MKRSLIYAGIFLGSAATFLALIFGLNYQGFKTLFENKEGMLEGNEYVEGTSSLKSLAEFIGEHPEYVSITSYNVEHPDSGIFYQDDVPRTLGSTANLILLIEYERQVSEGILDPQEIIQLNEIGTFALPDVSEKNHRSFLEAQKTKEAILDDLVSGMIEFNDQATADYLWFRLGEGNIRALMDPLNLPKRALPLPFSGMYISINPEINDTSSLPNMAFEDFAENAINQAESLQSDAEYRQSIREQFDKNGLSLTFMQERDMLKYFPKASTNELARLMEHLLKGELLSGQISDRVITKMSRDLKSKGTEQSFQKYGALYDNRMGLLGGVDFGTSAYDGHTSVQAIFFDRLPVGFWLHMAANNMQEDYQQRLIWDPALFETTLKEITSYNE